ncbi:MAG: type II toxin-antitoxin system RelE family toxin [Chthoniobacterales bacterium]
METKVELSEQVVRFVARRAPEPRRQLRAALAALANERGDIRALEGPLKDYHRLRIGSYRVIFAYRISGRRRVIQCIFAERRSAVYEIFEQLLKKHLLEGEKS